MTFKDFIETRRSKATRKTYSRVSKILGLDPDAFADLARRDKKAAAPTRATRMRIFPYGGRFG